MQPLPIANGMLINGQQQTPPVDEMQMLASQQPEPTYVYNFEKMDNLIYKLSNDELAKISRRVWSDTEQEESSYSEYKDRIAFYIDLSGFQPPSRSPKSNRSGMANDFIKNTGTSNLYSSALGETQLSIVTTVMSKFFGGEDVAIAKLHGPLDPSHGQTPPEVAQAIQYRVRRWYSMYFKSILRHYRQDMERTLMWACGTGTGDRKCYFDPVRGIPTSSVIPPGMLLNNSGYEGFFKPTEYTHVYYLTREEIQQRIDDGVWDEGILSANATYDQESILDSKLMEMQGKSLDLRTKTSDEKEMFPIYERYMDLELEDDSILPAIVTYTKEGALGAIHTNARENDPLQLPVDYFVHYRFLPSYQGEGLGLANVAGQNARAATVLKRRLIDASLAMAFPPAFAKSNFKFQSHTFEAAPGKITTLPVSDDDISKAIMFAPTATPNPFMTELKKDLEDNIRRYSLLVTDEVMQLAQRAPQGSVLGMLSRLEEMPNCIIQGFFESITKEFNIFKRMFYEWLSDLGDDEPFSIEMEGEVYTVYKNDFSEYVSILPAAPYTKESDAYKFMRGEIIAQNAEKLPQLHNMYNICYSYYKDMGLDDEKIKSFLVQPQPPHPADIVMMEAKQLPQVHDMRAALSFYYQSKQVPPEMIEAVLPPPPPPEQQPQQIDPGLVGMAEVEAQKQIAELNAHVKMAQIEVDKESAEAKHQVEIAKLEISRLDQEKKELELQMKIMKEQQELEIKEKELEIESLKYDMDRHDKHMDREIDLAHRERDREDAHFDKAYERADREDDKRHARATEGAASESSSGTNKKRKKKAAQATEETKEK